MAAGTLGIVLLPTNAGSIIAFTILFIVIYIFYNVNYAMTWAMMDEGAIPEKYFWYSCQVLFQPFGFLPEIFCSLLAGSLIDGHPGVTGYRQYFGFLIAMLVLGVVFVCIWMKIFEKKEKQRKLINNMSQKPYIIEKVYVETPVDTDGDGKKDLIAVYLRLPKEVEEGKSSGNLCCKSIYADM